MSDSEQPRVLPLREWGSVGWRRPRVLLAIASGRMRSRPPRAAELGRCERIVANPIVQPAPLRAMDAIVRREESSPASPGLADGRSGHQVSRRNASRLTRQPLPIEGIVSRPESLRSIDDTSLCFITLSIRRGHLVPQARFHRPRSSRPLGDEFVWTMVGLQDLLLEVPRSSGCLVR